MQTRVPSSISTVRHTGRTTPKLAVESPFVTPRKLRVSPATKAMTTNRSGTPSVQRGSDPCCVIGCSLRTITHTTHGWTANYTANAGWPGGAFSAIKRRFGPRCPPSHVVPRVPRTRVDCRNLQPRTGSQTVTLTPSSDSTKRYIEVNLRCVEILYRSS